LPQQPVFARLSLARLVPFDIEWEASVCLIHKTRNVTLCERHSMSCGGTELTVMITPLRRAARLSHGAFHAVYAFETSAQEVRDGKVQYFDEEIPLGGRCYRATGHRTCGP